MISDEPPVQYFYVQVQVYVEQALSTYCMRIQHILFFQNGLGCLQSPTEEVSEQVGSFSI